MFEGGVQLTHLNADYIVVGAGTSGCVVARRLLDRPGVSVLLIEAGAAYPGLPLDVPMAGLRLRRRWSWSLPTVEQPNLMGRSIEYPMGRVVGGSSSVNAMLSVPGPPEAFDAWGESGWSGAEMMQAFARAASADDTAPMMISEPRHRAPFSASFLEACVESGLKENALLYGDAVDTCGWFPVYQRDGKRESVARTYLASKKNDSYLQLLTKVSVRRVLLKNSRATGVEFVQGKNLVQANASRGVILSAGALMSPKLLLCSGVGPAEALSQVGIKPVVALPGVGKNLQDHLGVPLVFRTDQPTPGKKSRWLAAAWQYARHRDGPMVSTCGEAGCFISVDKASRNGIVEIFAMFQTSRQSRAVELMVVLSQPESRGSICLNPKDPWQPPWIDPNYLSKSIDAEYLMKGVHRARDIAQRPALRRFALREKSISGLSDHELISTTGTTFNHPVGGCCMGKNELAVVDAGLRVHGVERLWVADNSIAPSITPGHTASLAMMIGERASDLIPSDSSGV